MNQVSDPYRTLGVQRGVDEAQVKAAHRRLAKRFHPDGGTGDEKRFLAVQDAYQLLSDPVQRRAWDRRHSARPMDAHDRTDPRTDPRTDAGRARPGPGRAGSARWARENGNAHERQPLSRRERRRADTRTEGSGRDPRTRQYTWSAEGVPWWEDFSPRSGREEDAQGSATKPPGRTRGRSTSPAPEGASPSGRPARQAARPDMDVYNRSSGAAWSMAARRHFRADDADLPSRGAFRYRGTQVVTGAEARKVAAEEAAADASARSAERQRRANEEALRRREAHAASVRRPTARSKPVPPPSEKDSSRKDSSRKDDGSSEDGSSETADASTSPTVDQTASPTVDQTAKRTDRPTDRQAVSPTDRQVGEPASPAGRVADQAMLGTVAGALIAPASVLVAAGAAGFLHDAMGATLVLLLAAVSAVGAVVGRSLVRRRSDDSDFRPKGGDIHR